MNNRLNKFLKSFTVCGITGLLAFTTLSIVNNSVNVHYKSVKADTITDLTDTTWVFDDYPSIQDMDNDWSINFTSNNESFKMLSPYNDLGQEPPSEYLYYTSSNSNIWGDVTAYDDGVWTSLQYKTISIIGGEDVQDSLLIRYLQENATQQTGGGSTPEEPDDPEEPETPSETLTDLSNTQWNMNFDNWSSPSLSTTYYINVSISSGYYNSLFILNTGTTLSQNVFLHNTNTNTNFYIVREGVLVVDSLYLVIDSLGVDNQNTTLISWFLNNGSIAEPPTPEVEPTILETFTFEENFNFNAPVNLASNIQYFLKGDYTTNYDEYIYSLTLPRFIVGGVEYDTIKIKYANADGFRFEQLRQASDGSTFVTYPQISGTNYIFYLYMWFVDSTQTEPTLDLSNAVNSRTASRITGDNGTDLTYFTPNSYWRSPNFRTLYFIEELNTEQRTKLNAFNNNIYGFNQEVTNGYLVNVFNLFNLAFSSWLPILNMQLIPGITIGMLFFMPLVVGIILTIIWLVKR